MDTSFTSTDPKEVTDSLGKLVPLPVLPLEDTNNNKSPLVATSMKKPKQKPAAGPKSSPTASTKRKASSSKNPPVKKAKTTTTKEKNPPNSKKESLAVVPPQPAMVPSQLVVATDAANSNSQKKNQTAKNDEDSTKSSKAEAAIAVACCLCHCGLDCSDRGLFFRDDRQRELQELQPEETYYFTSVDDPYLDESLYDRHNALVYCDSCERLYHQKCHFVPLLVLPRGDWECLVCSQATQDNVNSKHV